MASNIASKISMNLKIPILLLTRNESNFLERTVRSIMDRTSCAHEIIICDNSSNQESQISLLNKFESQGIKIFRNTSNSWVMGLNPALAWVSHHHSQFDPDFCVISDADIEFPLTTTQNCWLRQALEIMRENKFMGKLGLSLSLDEISRHQEFQSIVQSEKSYQTTLLSPGIYLAPVDTTAAIYRYDSMVTPELRFYPGHNSYIRPDLYVGRSQHLIAHHMGWEKYGPRHEFNENSRAKIICFSLFGAYVDPLELAKAPFWLKLFRRIVYPLAKILWSSRLLWSWLIFILKSRMIYQNRLYFASRFDTKDN